MIPVPDEHRHTPHEALIAVPFGQDHLASTLPANRPLSRREALEAAILPHLRRDPCLVAFSGGRDSSVILAIAAYTARKHGLPEPIAVTHRFPEAPATDEKEWQEAAIRHLAISEWVRLEWTHELDMLGPFGVRVLLRHGPMFPFNAHFLEPFLERAGGGGSLLHGTGGDELCEGSARPHAVALMFEGRLPRHGQIRRTAREIAPFRVRARLDAANAGLRQFRWIRPDVREPLAKVYAESLARGPLAYDRYLANWYWKSRYVQCLRSTFRAMGSAHGAEMGAPFLDPIVIRAFARAAGHRNPPSRSDLMMEMAGDLLPAALLRRQTKATFLNPFWNRHSQHFVRSWTGSGVDQELVDPIELAAEWNSEQPAGTSLTLLHHAWLADSGNGTRIGSTLEDA